MSYKQFVDDDKKLRIQRWFYALVGVLTMIPILLLTLGHMRNMKRGEKEFGFDLLLLVHSGCVICSIIATALFCRVTDALLTSLTIILLSAYAGIHFYIRFLFDYDHVKGDYTVVTLRLGFVLIMLIILLPWTNIMTHAYRTMIKKEAICTRMGIFSWLLNFNTMLMISLLTLHIRSQADFNRQQLILLSIGVPLLLLWLTLGKLLVANQKCRHWTIWTIFFILSLIQIFHLSCIAYSSKSEYHSISKSNETSTLSLLIIIFICGCTNLLIHFLLMIISFCFFRCSSSSSSSSV